MLEIGAVRRPTGHLRLRPNRLVADKGYTNAVFRNYQYSLTILQRRNEHHTGTCNKQLYRKRNIVERLINRLKQFRRIATRYENVPLISLL